MKKALSITTLLATTAMVGSASAAIMAVETTEAISGDPHSGTIAALAGDLLETQGSIAAELESKPGEPAALTINGSIETNSTNVFKGGSGAFIEFDLDTSVNTLGYDITSVSTIAAWNDARAGQAYTVSVRQVGGSFNTLFTHTGANVSNVVNRVMISDSGSVIAGGIDGIRFDFANAPSGLNWSGYREIDLVGTATVPEPGSLALLGLGGLLVASRRRRG